MEVSHVPVGSASFVFERLRKPIGKALSHGCGDSITYEQMLARILNGNMTLWAIHTGGEVLAAAVLSVHTYPAKKTLVVELLAGRDMDKWADRVEVLLRDCRDLLGANTIEASCRVGLANRLHKRGWNRKAVIMEFE